MGLITKPMLSGKAPEDLKSVNFPVYASVKLDGIRALVVNGKLLSRTFKSIRNNHIRTTLEDILPDGIDGELLSGDTFQSTTSGIMGEHGTPPFFFHAFDYVKDDPNKPYLERIEDLKAWFEDTQPDNVVLVLPVEINNIEALDSFEAKCLAEGQEGVMLRSASGKYKMGRATTKEGTLMKVKRFSDAEGVVVGYEELMHNDNEALKDAFGRTKRSSHKANKRGAGVLGKFILKHLETGVEFGCGSGLNDEQRRELWENRESLEGKLVKFKYFEVGVLDKPRHPVFLGFRDESDV